MPRQSPQRITPRVVDSGTPRSPGLAVQANIDTHGGDELWAIAEALNNVPGIIANKVRADAADAQRKDKADYESGKLQRLQSDLTGDADAMTLQRPDVTEGFKRGYLESEGVVQLARLKNDMAADVAKLGPDDDFEQYVNEKTSTWLEEHASADPSIRKALIPGLARVVDQARGVYQQQATKEFLERQQDNLFALTVEGVKDGSLFTEQGREAIYQFAGRPEMGALERREVDPIIAQAFTEQLASGKVDPAKALAELEKPRPDGTPGIALIPKYRDDLLRAASAGQRQIDEARHAAEKQAEADISFRLDDLAERGILSDHAIKDAALKVGRGDDASWQLAWRNRNEAAVKRLQAEAKERIEKRDAWSYAETQDPRLNALPREQVQKAIGEQVLAAMDANAKQPGSGNDRLAYVMRVAENNGIVPDVLKNTFGKIDARNPQQFAALVGTFDAIAARSPTYARRIVDEKGLATIDAFRTLTQESGLRPEAAIEALSRTSMDMQAASTAVNTALGRDNVRAKLPKEGGNATYVDAWVRRNAALYQATGQFTPEAAIKRAAENFKTKHAVVNGLYMPNAGLKPDAADAADEIVATLKAKMIERGYATKDDDFFVGNTVGTMNPNDGKRAVYWMRDRMPVTDPDSGVPLLIDLNAAADAFAERRAKATAETTKQVQDYRQQQRQQASTEGVLSTDAARTIMQHPPTKL